MKAARLDAQRAWLQQKLNPDDGADADRHGAAGSRAHAAAAAEQDAHGAPLLPGVLLRRRPARKALLRNQEPAPLPVRPLRRDLDKKRQCWYGLLLAAMDIQRQHNVEQSAIIQLIQQMPHASWMGPKGSFHNKNEWETKLAQPGKLLEYNATRGKPEQIETPAVPRHLSSSPCRGRSSCARSPESIPR
jgi:hypothetical protein